MLNVDLQNYNMRKGVEEKVVSTNEDNINLFNRLEEKSMDIREHMRLEKELKSIKDKRSNPVEEQRIEQIEKILNAGPSRIVKEPEIGSMTPAPVQPTVEGIRSAKPQHEPVKLSKALIENARKTPPATEK